MKYITTTEFQTEALAEKLAKRLKQGDIIAFSGDLGVGKTAFTRGILNGLGYDGYVQSPTFSIVNEYLLPTFTVYHFDMYKISDEDSLYNLGFYDYLDENNILIIEWSENIINFLPKNIIKIDITRISEFERSINIGGLYENISI